MLRWFKIWLENTQKPVDLQSTQLNFQGWPSCQRLRTCLLSILWRMWCFCFLITSKVILAKLKCQSVKDGLVWFLYNAMVLKLLKFLSSSLVHSRKIRLQRPSFGQPVFAGEYSLRLRNVCMFKLHYCDALWHEVASPIQELEKCIVLRRQIAERTTCQQVLCKSYCMSPFRQFPPRCLELKRNLWLDSALHGLLASLGSLFQFCVSTVVLVYDPGCSLRTKS